MKKGPQREDVTKELLEELYVDDPKASAKSVGEILGVSASTVKRWLIHFGIPSKGKGRHAPLLPETQILADKDWLKKQLEQKTIAQIAEDLETPEFNVWYWRKKHRLADLSKSDAIKDGLKKRFPEGRKGDKHPRWKGGRRKAGEYIFLYAPDHPNAKPGKPYVQEHRLVMEKHLGRYLAPNEVIHHLNGVKDDNRIENLQLVQRGKHVSNHFEASHEVLEMRERIKELEAENKRLREQIKKQ